MKVRIRKPPAGITTISASRYDTSSSQKIATESPRYGSTLVARSSRLRGTCGFAYDARSGRPEQQSPSTDAAFAALIRVRSRPSPVDGRAMLRLHDELHAFQRPPQQARHVHLGDPKCARNLGLGQLAVEAQLDDRPLTSRQRAQRV